MAMSCCPMVRGLRATIWSRRAPSCVACDTQSQPWGKDFLSTLPIAGVDGTLENRMRGTPAAGLSRQKPAA